jgi:ribonucleotide reductase alpha subunit
MSGKKYTYDEALSASIKYFGGDELAAGVFVSKYALTDGATEYYELTPKDMHRRLAREFARIEEKYPNPMSEDDIFWLLDGFKYVVPAGSPMSGIGNTNQVQSLGNCFRAGTKIITISGIKNIEDVKIGDMVPTHKGNIKPVLQTHKNKLNDRQMFKIKCLRTPNIFVTGNHNFWSISQEQLEWGECPQWNPVEYLRKGDWIAIPNYNGGADSDDIDIAVDIFNKPVDAPVVYEKEVTKDTFQLFSCWNAGKSNAKCRKKHNIINRNWHIDEDFAFFLGLWYGDGCVFSPGHFSKKLKGITFTFGSHEKKLVRFVSKYGEKLLGIKPDINWNTDIDGSVQIVFNSPAAAYTFAEIFGRGCRGKKIPNRCFLWSKKLIDSLICGLVSSDGVVTKEGDVRVTLTNKNVIRYIYMLARMHGVPLGYSETSYCARLDFPKRSNYIKYVSKAYNDNRIKNSVKRAETTFQLKVIDGVTFVKIQQKEKVPAKKNEFVYTLGVKDDHSYCVEGVICQNCFVLDPPADSYGGILRTDQELVQLMKRRGGVGISISNIRPKGMPTKNAAKTTDGIAVFMERFSNSCLEVAQSARRGAELIALSVHHPEIEMFINIKRDDESKVTGANLSVLLTDEFMQAVRDDKEYEQRWPVDSETSTISKKVKARIVWNQIIESAWKRAEPGLLFIDTIRNNSPADIYGSVDKNFYSTASNPCVTGDTKVAVADGRGFVTFEDLAKTGDDVPVYSLDSSGEIVVKTMRNPRVTGKSVDVYRVNLDDGSSFETTENHKIYLKDGSEKRIDELASGDSLFVFSKFKASIKELFPSMSQRSQDYIWFRKPGFRTAKSEHRLFYKTFIGDIPKHYIIHHSDGNAGNNAINNLQCLSTDDHNKIHAAHMRGQNNPIFKIKSDPDKYAQYVEKQSAASTGENNPRFSGVSNEDIRNHAIILARLFGRKFSLTEWRFYAVANGLPVAFSGYRKENLGKLSELSVWAAEQCGFKYSECDPRVLQTLNDMVAQGYDAFIDLGVVYVNKKCEHCGRVFSVTFDKREQGFCDFKCSADHLHIECEDKRHLGIVKYARAHGQNNKQEQLRIYCELKSRFKQDPSLDQWENACAKENVPHRIKTKYGFGTWKELKNAALSYNHKVLSVEYIGKKDVYNGTVDDTHCYFMGGWESIQPNGKPQWHMVLSKNCGELVMGTDSCRLTSINLKSFVKNPFAKHAVFDFELFGRVTEMSQRLMDDLIDLELEKIDAIIAKVMSDPEPLETKQIELSLWQKMKDNCIKGRRTGLGITGLADVFATLGMRYGSNESIELTDKIYKALAIHAYRSSCTMAGERGSFPIFNRKLEEGHVFLSKIWEADHTVAELYNKNGRRNIALTTTPPAGSLSLLTQTSSGIEPVFMLEYERWRKISDSMPDTKIDRVDANGIAWQKYLVAHQGFQQWKSLTGLSDIESSPYYKSTALEIDWKSAVKLQATAQSWVCHSISRTNNIPKDSPKELVADIYIAAWESGCKGFTVYRDGCRDGVLTKKGEGNKEDRIKELERTNSDLMSELDKRKAMPVSVAPKRPDILESRTHKLKLDFGDSNLRNTYVTVSFFPGSKRPYEMFVQAPSSGLDEKDMQILELTARTTSMNLRHGLPIQHICEQLDKIGGQYIFSIPTTIARVLKLYVDETEEEPVRPELEQPELELPGGLMKCPKCGEKSYRPIGQTCGTCDQCGFSGCG